MCFAYPGSQDGPVFLHPTEATAPQTLSGTCHIACSERQKTSAGGALASADGTIDEHVSDEDRDGWALTDFGGHCHV